MSMRNIDLVVIERVMDVTLKTKLDGKLGVLVADIKLEVATNSLAMSRLNAMMEANVPLQVIISTGQGTFPEPTVISEQGLPSFETTAGGDILDL